MTKDEEIEFKNKINELIMPYALTMTEEQIKNIIINVEKQNSDLPLGFGAMLFEQIMLTRYKNNDLKNSNNSFLK